jgi:aminoglycoside 6'-N-acetyltransferase I
VAADIRRLSAADRGAWSTLRLALFDADPPMAVNDEIDELLADSMQAAYGAFTAEGLVGFAEVSERPWGEGCSTMPVAWIEAIYVLPGAQRGGIGRALVEAMAGWARARRLDELGSDVRPDNVGSLAAHTAWGFGETMRLVMFRRPL